jgi:hypothetical protein
MAMVVVKLRAESREQKQTKARIPSLTLERSWTLYERSISITRR